MLIIKELLKEDEAFLKDMFYESLFIPEGAEPYPRSLIDRPDLAKYHLDWGKDTDLGLVGEINGKKVGAVWCRFFSEENKGYGFIDESTPEMGIALLAEYRNQGIGTLLIDAMSKLAKKRNISALSLSVDPRNRAVNLYRRCGFVTVKEEGTSYTMLKRL